LFHETVVAGVLAPPECIRGQRDHAAHAPDDVVARCDRKNEPCPQSMLNDEDADQKAGREQGQRQGDPVRDLKAQIHEAQVPQKPPTDVASCKRLRDNVGV